MVPHRHVQQFGADLSLSVGQNHDEIM